MRQYKKRNRLKEREKMNNQPRRSVAQFPMDEGEKRDKVTNKERQSLTCLDIGNSNK